MSKRDYVMVARILASTDLPHSTRLELARKFAEEFESDNPRFDHARFYIASGIAV